jgi:tetratricopeptide (TPR) repeat protein
VSSGQSTSARGRFSVLWISLFLLVATLVLYWQVQGHGFLNYDDDLYVTGNPHVKAGLTGAGLVWALSDYSTGTWHPLTWLSLMVDSQFYGGSAGGFHLTNLFFHLANTLLLFFVLLRMTGARIRSGLVAALFALHPLHVESVAWISERKDVLSTFFWLLAISAYVRYAEKSIRKWYVLALLFYFLGLLAKPMIVTFPFLLLLLDYWPLRRIQKFSYRVKEKIPFFILTGIVSVVAFLTQQKTGALSTAKVGSFGIKLANVLVSYAGYVVKMLWPRNLSVLYPYPESFPFWEISLSVLLVFGMSFYVLRKARGKPWLPMGWFWYLGTLLPVIGLVQVGPQAMADRYSYVPLIGLFILIAWSIPKSWEKPVAAIPAAVVLFGLMTVSWVQIGYWHNTLDLFQHAVASTTDNVIAQNNFGLSLIDQGQIQEAIEHYSEALKIDPDFIDAQINLGSAFMAEGKYQDALAQYDQVLRTHPDNPQAHYNSGIALAKLGRLNEAVIQYQETLRVQPDDLNAHINLGVLLASHGHPDAAIEQYQEALKIEPDYVEALNNLGYVLSEQGKLEEAVEQFSHALRINPNYANSHYNLAITELKRGNQRAVIAEYEALEKLNPVLAKALSEKVAKTRK